MSIKNKPTLEGVLEYARNQKFLAEREKEDTNWKLKYQKNYETAVEIAIYFFNIDYFEAEKRISEMQKKAHNEICLECAADYGYTPEIREMFLDMIR